MNEESEQTKSDESGENSQQEEVEPVETEAQRRAIESQKREVVVFPCESNDEST